MSLATFTDTARPITLDELVSDASMLTRVDRKYLLTATSADRFVDALPSWISVLDIDTSRHFGYRSTYFDTPDHAAYTSAGRRRRRRFKVRVREYLDTDSAWLEIKTRGPRGTTVKQRIAHVGAPDQLGDDGRRFVAATFRDARVDGVDAHQLTPVLETSYRRMTLHVPGREPGRQSTRATIDTALSWLDLVDDIRLDLPKLVFVETKGGPAPSPADRILWQLGHRPQVVSKYAIGLATLHPDLPALKWHRTLNLTH